MSINTWAANQAAFPSCLFCEPKSMSTARPLHGRAAQTHYHIVSLRHAMPVDIAEVDHIAIDAVHCLQLNKFRVSGGILVRVYAALSFVLRIGPFTCIACNLFTIEES